MTVREGFAFLIITEHEDRLTIYQTHFEPLATCEQAATIRHPNQIASRQNTKTIQTRFCQQNKPFSTLASAQQRSDDQPPLAAEPGP